MRKYREAEYRVTYEDGTTEVFDTEKKAQEQVSRCENAYYSVRIYDQFELEELAEIDNIDEDFFG